MISYKTYRECKNPPEGVNPDWVWQMSFGEIPGWTHVTEEQYNSYVEGHSAAIQAWADWSAGRSVMVSVRDNILTPAMVFGNELIKEFASENIAMGITQDGLTSWVRDIAADIMGAVSTGSLYDAMVHIKHIDPSEYDTKYITAARLLSYLNKIEAYLNLPLSESL
jgi:hypothetical protein